MFDLLQISKQIAVRHHHVILLVHYLRKTGDADTRKEITVLQKGLELMQKRDLELTVLFKRLYCDNVLGRIPDEY
jgi:hypothetical protein